MQDLDKQVSMMHALKKLEIEHSTHCSIFFYEAGIAFNAANLSAANLSYLFSRASLCSIPHHH